MRHLLPPAMHRAWAPCIASDEHMLVKPTSPRLPIPPPRRFAEELRRFPDVFQSPTPASLTLNPALSSPEERSRAVDDVLKTLQARGLVDGWRGELYPVAPSFHAPPLLSLERAAAVHFGIKAYGGMRRAWAAAGRRHCLGGAAEVGEINVVPQEGRPGRGTLASPASLHLPCSPGILHFVQHSDFIARRPPLASPQACT